MVGKIPASSVAAEDAHGALDTTWVNIWNGLEVSSTLCIRGCFQVLEGLNKLFASILVSSVLKFLIVANTSIGLQIFGLDITTAVLPIFLSPDEPPISVRLPMEDSLMNVEESSLQASNRANILAGSLRVPHVKRDTALIFEGGEYYLNLLKESQTESCRDAPVPAAPPTTSTSQVVETIVDKDRHVLFSGAVG